VDAVTVTSKLPAVFTELFITGSFVEQPEEIKIANDINITGVRNFLKRFAIILFEC
jgi:hypothetical protein